MVFMNEGISRDANCTRFRPSVFFKELKTSHLDTYVARQGRFVSGRSSVNHALTTVVAEDA